MKATFLAKRALFNIPKFFPQPYIQSSRTIARACLSTAFEGSNAVAETADPNDGNTGEGMVEAKQRALGIHNETPAGSTTSFAADTAKDAIKKATEMAENVGDRAKATLDGAWKAAKGAVEGIEHAASSVSPGDDEDEPQIEEDPAVGEIKTIDQPVDTQEYRIIEELKAQEVTNGHH